MCDAISSLESAATVWAPSILPQAVLSYTGISIVLALAIFYMAYRQIPSEKLARLTSQMGVDEKLLDEAKTRCPRTMRGLLELEERLLQVKRTASEVKIRLLKAEEEEVWKDYLQTIREVMQTISDCRIDMKEIRTDILVIMEEETQRKLSEGVNKTRVTLATIYTPILHVPLNIRRRRGARPESISV
ncbi:hypothetical protein FB45DRAFT_947911 [Roridomyces roridus]|uniref:Uncharacterized protein n=1 Tax=Roridomyces roridus TaxID=1738132 RepID=A0AAD7B1J4_9AGAR|nr:hypothetical protein FB45DRAFT_947911 [Roridomyces roridus]